MEQTKNRTKSGPKLDQLTFTVKMLFVGEVRVVDAQFPVRSFHKMPRIVAVNVEVFNKSRRKSHRMPGILGDLVQ
jgi:hypothetical protein